MYVRNLNHPYTTSYFRIPQIIYICVYVLFQERYKETDDTSQYQPVPLFLAGGQYKTKKQKQKTKNKKRGGRKGGRITTWVYISVPSTTAHYRCFSRGGGWKKRQKNGGEGGRMNHIIIYPSTAQYCCFGGYQKTKKPQKGGGKRGDTWTAWIYIYYPKHNFFCSF